MAKLSDEILMAYADGALNAKDRAAVESVLATDPDSRAALAAFVTSGQVLGQIFEQPMHEAVPDQLIHTVKEAAKVRAAQARSAMPQQAGASKTHWLDGAISTLRDFSAPRRWAPIAGAAAAAALVIVTFNLQMDEGEAPEGPQVSVLKDDSLARPSRTPGPLDRFLETAPMKQAMEWRERDGSAKQGRIVFSFLSRKGEFCRQYELSEGAKEFSGIACRLETGDWSVRVNKPKVRVSESAPGDLRTFSPAAGEHDQTIDAIVDQMIDGDVLSVEDEAALLQSNWRVEKK